jgi:hypothetical protein
VGSDCGWSFIDGAWKIKWPQTENFACHGN